MHFKIHKTLIYIDFSFVLMLCISMTLNINNISLLLLYSFLHELGHLIALIILGHSADELRLSFFGAALRYGCALSKAEELTVIAAGPLVNLMLYLILKDNINLSLLIINIMPVYPLDGGRILYSLSPRICRITSIVLIVLLLVTSVYLLVYYRIFSLFFICIYLIIFACQDSFAE